MNSALEIVEDAPRSDDGSKASVRSWSRSVCWDKPSSLVRLRMEDEQDPNRRKEA